MSAICAQEIAGCGIFFPPTILQQEKPHRCIYFTVRWRKRFKIKYRYRTKTRFEVKPYVSHLPRSAPEEIIVFSTRPVWIEAVECGVGVWVRVRNLQTYKVRRPDTKVEKKTQTRILPPYISYTHTYISYKPIIVLYIAV